MYKIEISSLESEKQEIIYIYKKQLEAFRYIKKEIERVQWSDANYDRLVESMNMIGRELCKALQAITNGNDVYVISDLLPLAREYKENGRRFPKL